MNNGLYENGELLTRYVNIIAQKEAIKVENKLLDGSFHIQTIGAPADVLNMRIFVVGEETKEKIDEAEALCSEVTVVMNGKYWTGIIRSVPSWQRRSTNVYEAEMTLLVREKGVV